MPPISKFAAACGALLLLASNAAAQSLPPAPRLTAFDLDPARLLAPPPAEGSVQQLTELAEVHRLIRVRSPERLAQAIWDDQHENVSIYAATLGPAFDLTKLPATAALLAAVDAERKKAEDAKAFFKRKRPWAFDATVIPCDGGQMTKNPLSGYPSGHALTGYSLGLALSSLLPGKAQAIQARAQDYAYSREICGAHYHSDVEASHVLATALVTAVWLNPAMAPSIAAARAELAAAGL